MQACPGSLWRTRHQGAGARAVPSLKLRAGRKANSVMDPSADIESSLASDLTNFQKLWQDISQVGGEEPSSTFQSEECPRHVIALGGGIWGW